MAPGPPNLANNMFASLSSSPKNKKKRPHKNIEEIFPTLPSVIKENPKYIIVSSTTPDKKLTDISCFAVHKSLKLISKEILSISELKDGNLLLLVKNENIAKKFIQANELHGLCSITCSLHENLNYCKGTIYAPYLKNVSNEEIIAELKDQGVVDIYKFNSFKERKMLPSEVILVTFDKFHLPEKINISWYLVQVREYFPNPMRCKACQKTRSKKTKTGFKQFTESINNSKMSHIWSKTKRFSNQSPKIYIRSINHNNLNFSDPLEIATGQSMHPIIISLKNATN